MRAEYGYVGVIIGSLVSARFGRRCCMFSMSCFALVTATIAVTSVHREQILVARILNCESTSCLVAGNGYLCYTDIYIGMELSVVPVYQSEIVPTRVRCLIVGTYQFSLIVRPSFNKSNVGLTHSSLEVL